MVNQRPMSARSVGVTKQCAVAACQNNKLPGKPYCAKHHNNHTTKAEPDSIDEQPDLVKQALMEIYTYFLNYTPKSDTMNNTKFVKALKTLKWIDKKTTSTDADLIFTKVKAKGEKKIGFEQFYRATCMLAQKKFSGDENALMTLLMSAQMPQMGTQMDKSGWVSRLTDHKFYTGAHKARFDEEGKGKGAQGRDACGTGIGSVPQRKVMTGQTVKDLSEITRNSATGEDRGKTHCSTCGAKKSTRDQASCARCGKLF